MFKDEALPFPYHLESENNGVVCCDNNRYDKIIDNIPEYYVTNENFFIEIANTSIKKVFLPEADFIGGRRLIILKGYDSTYPLYVYPKVGSNDSIDENPFIPIEMYNQRLSLMSSGVDKWVII